MMLLKNLLIIFFVIFNFGCTTLKPIELVSQNRTELRGYSTNCEGKMLFKTSSNTTTSKLITSAGPQEIRLDLESRAIPTVGILSSNYACFEESKHIVKFNAVAGKTYRFYAEPIAEKTYKITAYEYLNPRFPEAHPVRTTWTQLSIKRHCGFRAGIESCNVGPTL